MENFNFEEKKLDYEQKIVNIIRSSMSPKVIKNTLENYHENDIANSLEWMNPSERKRLYRILDVETVSDILECLDVADAVAYLEEMDIKKKVDVVSNMEADKIVCILQKLSLRERETLVELMDSESKKDVALLASFDSEQIGSRMTVNYIAITHGLTVKEAMNELIRQAADNDNISMLYVLDEHGVFYGAIGLHDLLIARPEDTLDDLIVTSYPFVYAKEQIDNCIEWLKEYSEDSIPALDEHNKLIGVITAQDVIEVIDAEMGEDYARLAGLTAEEDLNESVKDSVKKRLPWLITLLGLGLVVSSVVGLFEGVVAELTIIICFQSLILDMAGNVGTQSLAVTIRVLMDERLSAKQKLGLIWKEAKVGLSNGLILGTLSFFFIGQYVHFLKGYAWGFSFATSACIGLALLVAMLVSSIVGTLIPMSFKKIGVDPAVASGPLITTVNDLVAVVTYYGLSWLFLLRLFHF